MIAWEGAVRDHVRLEALADSSLVGTGPEDAFDRLIELAVELTGVPRGCITLVDAERTTAKSAVGFPEGVDLFAPVEHSFCRFVIASGHPLIVDDAERDPRTTGDPAIAAFAAVTWAGYPVEDADGVVLGTFCLMDSSPHEWTPRDLRVVATLARCASTEVALRGSLARARRASEAVGEKIDELIASAASAASAGLALQELQAWLRFM